MFLSEVVEELLTFVSFKNDASGGRAVRCGLIIGVIYPNRGLRQSGRRRAGWFVDRAKQVEVFDDAARVRVVAGDCAVLVVSWFGIFSEGICSAMPSMTTVRSSGWS